MINFVIGTLTGVVLMAVVSADAYRKGRKDAVIDILDLAHCRAERCTMDGFCDACIDCIINPADIFYHEKAYRPLERWKEEK